MENVSIETLREALIDLEKTRLREAEQKLIAETLLNGLKIISTDSNSKEMFSHLFDFFKDIIPSETCYFAEVGEENNFFRCLYHSKISIECDCVDLNPFILSKLKSKRVTNLFETSEVQHLNLFTSFDKGLINGSALLVPVVTDSTNTMLCFLKKDRGGFDPKYLSLAERFIPILRQAILKMNYLEKIILSNRMFALVEMSGGVAHEINNPLAILMGNLKIFRKKLDEENVDSSLLVHLDKIGMMADRISKIVDGMRTVSQNTDSEVPVQIEIREVLNDAMSFIAEKIKKYDIKLNFELDESIEIQKYNLYKVKLTQVILNLLNNAVDAIKELTDDKWISIFVFEQDEKMLNIVVVDSGMGIPNNLDSKIFEPFFTTKPIGEGTGLGLSLCKSMVKSMQGQLFVDRHYKNTAFHLVLPLR